MVDCLFGGSPVSLEYFSCMDEGYLYITESPCCSDDFYVDMTDLFQHFFGI